ncbi:MAG TPA: RidA family protein [Myxococcales bacterium]|nr:RidA family protein [Myxococcales bacterium]
MAHQVHDIGVAKNIGKYSDALEAAPGLRWLYSAGTPGMTSGGELPAGIEAQARLVWQNVVEILKKANMTVRDLVKVTSWLTNAADIPAYAKVRTEFLGEVQPAFMLAIVPGLIRPAVLVEIEIVAAAQ